MKDDFYNKVVNLKKSIHIAITKENHVGMKVECAKRDLSLQEVFEEFASRIVAEDKNCLKILEELSEIKRLGIKQPKQLRKSEINDIYSILEDDDPLKD